MSAHSFSLLSSQIFDLEVKGGKVVISGSSLFQQGQKKFQMAKKVGGTWEVNTYTWLADALAYKEEMGRHCAAISLSCACMPELILTGSVPVPGAQLSPLQWLPLSGQLTRKNCNFLEENGNWGGSDLPEGYSSTAQGWDSGTGGFRLLLSVSRQTQPLLRDGPGAAGESKASGNLAVLLLGQ